jgi:hypothetical protein
MRTLGGLLLVVGVALVVLDLVGVDLLASQIVLGVILAAIGLALILLGQRGDRRLEGETIRETRADDADVVTRTTATGTAAVPPADGPVSSPVGYGPPAEAGAAPGTATTTAPGEATVDAERRYDTTDPSTPRDPARDRDPRA